MLIPRRQRLMKRVSPIKQAEGDAVTCNDHQLKQRATVYIHKFWGVNNDITHFGNKQANT